MARYWVDMLTFKKKFKKKIQKNFKKNSKKIQKNHKVTRGTPLGWHVYI